LKVSEIVTLVQSNYQTAVPDATLIHYINMLEDRVYSEIVGTLDTEPLVDDTGTEPVQRDQYRPVIKTFALMDTQDLEITKLGNRWAELYEYYLYSRIALLNKDFEDYQNYATFFNGLMDDFFKFYNSRRKTARTNWR